MRQAERVRPVYIGTAQISASVRLMSLVKPRSLVGKSGCGIMRKQVLMGRSGRKNPQLHDGDFAALIAGEASRND